MTPNALIATFNAWLAKVDGKKIEAIDGSNLYQCYDLAVSWLDALGIPRLASGGSVFPHLHAYQIYTVWSGEKLKHFTRHENTPDAMPQKGDLIIWGNTYGTSGHVAVATDNVDLKAFWAVTQNDPLGSATFVRRYNYNHILGWLRFKTESETTTPVINPDTSMRDFDTHLEQSIKDKSRVSFYKDDRKRVIDDLIKSEIMFREQATKLSKSYDEIGKLKEKIEEKQEDIQLLQDQKRELEQAKTKEMKEFQAEIKSLQKEVDKERDKALKLDIKLTEQTERISSLDQRVLELGRDLDKATNSVDDEILSRVMQERDEALSRVVELQNNPLIKLWDIFNFLKQKHK